MKFNLIPQEQRASSWELLPPPFFRILAVLLTIVILGSAAASVAFYTLTVQEKERFTDQAFPVQQYIMRQNDLEQQMKKLKDANDSKRAQVIYWPAVLVCLAESKPPNAVVEKINVHQNTISVYGTSSEEGIARTWQEKLRHQPFISSVTANRIQKNERNSKKVFQLDIEWDYDKTAASS